jgi:hypothetical protein
MPTDLERLVDQASKKTGLDPNKLLEGISEGRVILGVNPEIVRQHYAAMERSIANLAYTIGKVGVDGLKLEYPDELGIELSQRNEKDLIISVNSPLRIGYHVRVLVGASLTPITNLRSDLISSFGKNDYVLGKPRSYNQERVVKKKGVTAFDGLEVKDHVWQKSKMTVYISTNMTSILDSPEKRIYFQLIPWLRSEGLNEGNREIVKGLQFLPYAINEGVARKVASTLESPVS